MGRLVEWCIGCFGRRPRAVVAAAVALTLVCLPGVASLRLRTDGNALVASGDLAIETDSRIRAEFDLEDPIAVVLWAPPDRTVYDVELLRRVARLTEAIQSLPQVDSANVSSLATERTDRVKTGTLEFRRFLEPLPETVSDLQRVERDVAKVGVYDGTLVSRDRRATAIVVGVDQGVDRAALASALRRCVETDDHHGEAMRVDVVGAPVAESLLGRHILEDLGVPSIITGVSDRAGVLPIGLVPLTLLIILAVFWVRFRRLTAALLPLLEVGAAIVFVFGVMGYCGVPVYLTTAVLPIVLASIGIADEIHLFHRYQHLVRRRAHPARESVTAAVRDMAPPIIKTSLTTAVAFLSFLASPVEAVRWFGLFAAVGILYCMLWSLIVVPATLLVLPDRWLVPATEPVRRRFALPWGVRWPALVVVVVVAGLVTLPAGWRRIVVQDSWIGGFAANSPFRTATESVDGAFDGTHLLHVRVSRDDPSYRWQVVPADLGPHRVTVAASDSNDPRGWVGQWVQVERVGESDAIAPVVRVTTSGARVTVHTDPRTDSLRSMRRDVEGEVAVRIGPRAMLEPGVLRQLRSFETFLETQPSVGGVLGVSEIVRASYAMNRGARKRRTDTPRTDREVLATWRNFEAARGSDRRREVVDDTHRAGLITVFLKGANFRATATLMDSVRNYADRELAAHGLRVEFAGDVAVSQSTISAVVATQGRSMVWSFLGVLLVSWFLCRSLRWSLVCLVPCTIAVMVNLAVMGWLGIPLGIATSMFAAMTFGLGVDYAIHFVDRYRGQRGASTLRRVVTTLRVISPPVALDCAAIALGFGALAFSRVPANAHLGGLVAASVVTSTVATIVLVPALILLGDTIRIRWQSRRPALTPEPASSAESVARPGPISALQVDTQP